MWKFIIFVSCIHWANSQFNQQRYEDQAWNIKFAVPGAPGVDYPTLNNIPRTSFNCAGKKPGYYADQETNCQVFKVCTAGSTYGFQSFLCPNGTLFNQAVFVCDWWMNVNCGKSQELINNQRFGKIRLGPQLMKDIKKMITHPMRNPYDSGFVRNNFVVVQEYKPPSEQLYSNGALVSNQDKNTNNVYVPFKGLFRNFGQNIQNTDDIDYAATTAAPQYLYPLNSIPDTQIGQYVDFQRTQNPKIKTFQKSNFGYVTQAPKRYAPFNFQKTNTQSHNQKQTLAQYKQNGKTNTQTNFEFNKINQQKHQDAQKLYQSAIFNSNRGGEVKLDAKQNVVSTDVTPTIISKTIAFKTILPGEKPGHPKSRITFKTWILKPKNSKLVVEPTSHSYKNPTPTASEKLQSSIEPYIYDIPRRSLDLTNKNDLYFYDKPTNLKFVSSTPSSRLYASPTTFRPTVSSRLYLAPLSDKIITPLPPESLYESPTTYKSVSNTYIPPIITEKLPQQYLPPTTASQRLQSSKNARLIAASSSQTPQFEYYNTKSSLRPTLTVTKQSQVNTNHNNLTFTDVHTKEKLDITVNDIVKKSFNKPQSSPPKQIAQYPNRYYFDDNFLNAEKYTGSKEELTSTLQMIRPQSAKLVASPSTELQPPSENVLKYVSSNKLSNLPYYKEPTNTIERTVSIKITLPERIAKLLFRNESENDSDDLEILNTGNSNYLVYANHLASNAGTSLIPIGKLSLKNSNISNSQDLVFSFLADSLNAAKEYSNIAKQNTISTPSVQNFRSRAVQGITNEISQLTSSQFTNDNNAIQHNNIQQYTSQSQAIARNKDVSQFNNNEQQNGYQQQRLRKVTPLQPITQNRLPTTLLQHSNNRLQNTRQNQNQIYSGQLYQLPVPEVTGYYYNSPSNKENYQQQQQRHDTYQNIQQKQVNNDIEIIPSLQIPFNEYQQTSTNQESSKNLNNPSKDLNDLIRSGNGITAQLQDSIVGRLPHPIEKDKLLTYKKDQSYYIFSQLNSVGNENNHINDDKPNTVELQYIPSVSFKINDDTEKQKILNDFQINDFGVPQGVVNGYRNPNQRQDISTDVDYTVNHPSNYGDKINDVQSLYNGLSSYNAPQILYNSENKLAFNNQNSRIEILDVNKPIGYPKASSPLRKFDT